MKKIFFLLPLYIAVMAGKNYAQRLYTCTLLKAGNDTISVSIRNQHNATVEDTCNNIVKHKDVICPDMITSLIPGPIIYPPIEYVHDWEKTFKGMLIFH